MMLIADTIVATLERDRRSQDNPSNLNTDIDVGVIWWFFPLLIGLGLLLWAFFRKHFSQDSGSASINVVDIEHQPPVDELVDTLEIPQHTSSAPAIESVKSTKDFAEAATVMPVDPIGGLGMQSNSMGQDSTSNTSEVGTGEEVVLPVIEEEATIQTQEVERGKVQVLKRVETRETVVNAPIIHETVVVEHIPVNQYIEDDVPAAREADGVLIIPVIEEVLFTEKRLILREEVRVFKQRKVAAAPQTITLHRESVTIERTEIPPSGRNHGQDLLNPPSVLEATTATHDDSIDPLPVSSNLANPAELQKDSKAVQAIASNMTSDDQPTTEEVVIPVVAEEVTIQIQQVERGKVHIHKQVETREEVIAASAMYEQVMVEHVPLNQYVDGNVPVIREEQGVLIIPVVEEVTIAEKRLLLREEVHISRQRKTEIIPQTVSLRHEVVAINQIQLEPAS